MAPLVLDESPGLSDSQLKAVPALRHVQVDVSESSVTLSGIVTSFYYKQLAQETILPLLRGRKLHNRLMVVKH